MRRSQLPFVLALVAFGLTMLSGGYAYNRFLRTVPVLVAVQDIAPATSLTAELVRVARVPAGGTGADSLYGPGQIAGKYAAVPIFRGEALTARHVTGQPPETDRLSALAQGQRVVSLPVRPEAVLGGALRPGDIVDVAAAFPPSGEGKPSFVEVLAGNVPVVDLRNGSALSIQDGKPTADGRLSDSVPTSVLLVVSSAQAKTLVGAVESKATIYLWLVGRDRE